jgi:REP element-mobilizing transposase RayT
MPVKRKITNPDGVYFITFTSYQWLHLIEITNSYDLIYNWFDHLKSKGHYIAGYVIMPNHVHSLIAFRNTGKSINTIVGNGKRFMAYEIVKRLEARQDMQTIELLQSAVETTDRKRNKKHEVWEDSFDRKECISNEFIEQKLDYMHENPCRGKWKLAEDPASYPHSSALFYLTGEQGLYEVFNYLALGDIDLTNFPG